MPDLKTVAKVGGKAVKAAGDMLPKLALLGDVYKRQAHSFTPRNDRIRGGGHSALVASSTLAKASAKIRALLSASSSELPAAPTSTSMEPRDLCWL